MKFVMAALLASSYSSLAPAAAASCVDIKDREELRAEYFLNGGRVPECVGRCADSVIFSQICDGKNIKPNCFTTVGIELTLKNYSGPIPAGGPECARNQVLAKLCPNL